MHKPRTYLQWGAGLNKVSLQPEPAPKKSTPTEEESDSSCSLANEPFNPYDEEHDHEIAERNMIVQEAVRLFKMGHLLPEKMLDLFGKKEEHSVRFDTSFFTRASAKND